MATKEQKREKYERSAAYEIILANRAKKLRRLKIKKYMKRYGIGKTPAIKLWEQRRAECAVAETKKALESASNQ